VGAAALLEAIYRLRFAVWAETVTDLHRHYPDGRMVDLDDATAVHLVALDGATGAPIAAARVTFLAALAALADPIRGWFTEHQGHRDPPVAFLSRLVCAAGHRGAGLARALDHARVAIAEQRHAPLAAAVASSRRVRSLATHGFVAATDRGPFAYHLGGDRVPLIRPSAPVARVLPGAAIWRIDPRAATVTPWPPPWPPP
jgi:predicted GNAT superfamily acetyltransferase